MSATSTDPRRAGLRAAVRDWMEDYGLHPDPETYLAHGYVDLCLSAWPAAAGVPLLLATEWATWTWLADDALDSGQHGTEDVQALTGALIRTIADRVPSPAPRPPAAVPPLARALEDLRRRTRALMPQFWWERYQRELEIWIMAAGTKLVHYLRPRKTPNLSEYLRLRPTDGGMRLAAMWCELAAQCITPDWADPLLRNTPDWAQPLLRELLDTFSMVGVLVNDLAADGNDLFTAVRALAVTEGLTVEEARGVVEQQLRAERQRFRWLCIAVRSMAAEPEPVEGSVGQITVDIGGFALLLDQFLCALTAWTRESSRYAATRPAPAALPPAWLAEAH